ncbi:MAG: hypothetical protein PW735_05840 [Acidobacteriaceae bacterium]|nr:hypothetical protein [Acidobacteriaceae bacterium]
MKVFLLTHGMPLWFLILSLFLPRLCMAIAFVQHSLPHHIPTAVGAFQILAWLLVPRLLILFWIYQDQGVGLWFVVHALGLLFAWGGGGGSVVRRRRIEVDG